MKILIKNGRVIDPANQRDHILDIAIESGKIAFVGNIPVDFSEDIFIDAQGKWVTPGWVDLCHRPYQNSRLKFEAQIALKKGITALCMPPDVDQIVDHPDRLLRWQQETNENTANLYAIGALTKDLSAQAMTDYAKLKEAGCIALSQAQAPLQNYAFLRSCYEYASSLDIPVIIQPQEPTLSHGCAHEGVVSTRLGLSGIPYIAETVALSAHLALIEETDLKAHFTCLSSHRSVELIAAAKAKGLNVSADVAMHSLVLSEMDLLEFDSHCHLYPPLRSQTDQLGLLHGVQSGVIDAICSDHRPLDSLAKLAPFADTLPGLSAIDTFLSLGLYLIDKGKLDIFTLIRAVTERPASLFNLPEGTFCVGRPANLCVIDPAYQWTLLPETMLSQGKNSPFLDWQFSGRVTHTLIDGKVVFTS